MNPLDLIPAPYRILAMIAFAVALMGFGWVKGARHVQHEWDAAEGARAKAVAQAYTTRIASNQVVAAKQAADNAAIQKGKDDEIARLTAAVNSAPRLRVGTAICGGPAATAKTEGAGSGDCSNSPIGLVQPDPGRDSDAQVEVREDVDRDLKALKLAVETDLATGRACQAFIKANDLVP